MNRDFEKRSKTVFQVLSLLVEAAPQLVFLGGSAIQALLEKPKRLSIDLDISYPGEVKSLLASLESAGYAVAERHSRSPSSFLFYTVSKEEVMVKLDVSRFAIPETENHKIAGKTVRIPRKCYFLAAKLSSLAFGTIGRFEQEPIQITKDVFDINCLLDIDVDLDHMAKDWHHIVTDQNRLRGTQFSEVKCAESVQSALLRCVEVTPLPEFFIPQSALGSFEQSLIGGRVLRQDIATMAARALLLLVNMDNSFYELEKQVASESGNRQKLDEAEQILAQKKILEPGQIRAIKIVAPRALIYLKFWSERKRGDNPLTSSTPGTYKPRYS
jgi:hypothetical protein